LVPIAEYHLVDIFPAELDDDELEEFPEKGKYVFQRTSFNVRPTLSSL
jgi:hypothetical protein